MTKTSLCPAVDDQGRKCRKLLPHFDYEHIFMDEPSKGPIPPALSPEEWAKRQIAAKGWLAYIVSEEDAPDEVGQLGITSSGHDGESFEGRARHAIAALALHGQPFGFTREDVEFLMDMDSDYEEGSQYSRAARSLIARIAALLPPSDEKPQP